MDYRDYYQVLGVSKSADEKEIRSAFRKLAQQYHPDKNLGDKRAEEKFKEINEAYEVLGDAEKRARYDQLGSSYQQWERAGRPGMGFDFGQWAGTGGRSAGQGGAAPDLNDLFSQGSPAGFSEFFTTIFGGSRRGGTTTRTRTTQTTGPWGLRGEDMEQPVEISLEDAYRGTKRTLQKGDRRLEVNIPAGAKTGTRIRLTGAGGTGQQPGDLYVVINVRPHPTLRRDGDDLHMDAPIELYTAVLGGEARISTLAGDVTLNVPAETQPGKTFRLTGKGMPKLKQAGSFGDLYARVMVRLPSGLTEEERGLYRKLAELNARRPTTDDRRP
jgi:curved DNA-binding protein